MRERLLVPSGQIRQRRHMLAGGEALFVSSMPAALFGWCNQAASATARSCGNGAEPSGGDMDDDDGSGQGRVRVCVCSGPADDDDVRGDRDIKYRYRKGALRPFLFFWYNSTNYIYIN
jgi:hypothetical protein